MSKETCLHCGSEHIETTPDGGYVCLNCMQKVTAEDIMYYGSLSVLFEQVNKTTVSADVILLALRTLILYMIYIKFGAPDYLNMGAMTIHQQLMESDHGEN